MSWMVVRADYCDHAATYMDCSPREVTQTRACRPGVQLRLTSWGGQQANEDCLTFGKTQRASADSL